MPTFGDLINRVRSQAMGYARDQEQISELSADMTATDTTFTVDPATANSLGRGLCQIDDELLLIKSVDQSSGIVTIIGGLNGRGFAGSVAVAHTSQALVITSPAFPRIRIKEAINDTITGMYPKLVQFASTEISKSAVVFEYGLPAAAKDVWYVTDQTIGPSKIWMTAPNWRFNPFANLTDFPTGKSIQLLDGVTPGRLQRVVYVKAPTVLATDGDDFEAVSGWPARMVDLVTAGATAKLLPPYEAARLQQKSIEASERSDKVPPLSAAKAAQFYMGIYLQRVEEERNLQFQEVPNFQHWNGS